MISSTLSWSLMALIGSALGADLPSIVIKGSKFFYPNGTQFIMKGIAYQQATGAAGSTPSNTSYVDPLADNDRCKVDIPNLVSLKTNVIRVYAIDPTKDHSTCMKLLNDNGIYVVADLGEPGLSINRDDPAWDTALFDRYRKVVDELVKYSNVIGFFAGNEVSNTNNNTGASAYVKAAARDTKAYIKSKNYRPMGVGYAANDDKPIRDQIASYFNCGPTEDSIDFFGYNIYSWCGDSNFEASGYNRLIEYFKSYSVPMFFAEYGCNLPNGGADRTFEETTALYVNNMTDVVSGGIVYEYFEETNNYGLVKISNGGSATKLKSFSALEKKISSANAKGVDMSSYNPTNKALECPTVNSLWEASSSLPPTPNDSACNCMVKAASCVPSGDLKKTSYGDIFGFICGKDAAYCAGITGNTTTGKYGSFSMCSSQQKLAYVLDAYYKKNGKGACDFKGQAKTQSASGSLSSCAKLAPGSNGANSTSGGNGNGSGNGSGNGNGNGNGNGTDSFAVLGAPLTRVGGSAVGLYLVSAVFGAAMVAFENIREDAEKQPCLLRRKPPITSHSIIIIIIITITMEIIIVGATGYVGSAVLERCLSDASISRIFVLTRRPLGDAQTASPEAARKVSVVIKMNWIEYDDELLERLRGARACIWCIGGRHTQHSRWATPEEYLAVTVDYTVAAARAFARMMGTTTRSHDDRFRFVFCSGDASELVYNRSLWIMGPTRRAKGCAEKNIFDIADASDGALESITVRPCGIYPRRDTLWSWFLTRLVLPTLEVGELAKKGGGTARADRRP
ncbi:hypothetical protein EsDP_00006185 [Epichloe bromicola]|uniref:1,3-beta-glucanosyltransferase n=1 Tax=Epichloe bromicola TaxID=79588 RepID=A0ABQ0CWU9_9HYPO